MRTEFLYLFLIDLFLVKMGGSYAECAKDEPSYGPGMVNAYLTAFDQNQAKKIMSHDLLKSIHKEAMAWQGNSGQYKTTHNSFKSYPKFLLDNNKIKKNLGYTHSEEGILQFLMDWFVENPHSFHKLYFTQHNVLPRTGLVIKGYDHEKGVFKCNFLKESKKYLFKRTPYDLALLIKNFLNLNRYTLQVTFFDRLDKDKLASASEDVLSRIFNRYNQKIRKCRTDSEILETIVEHVQHINQLHPFLDGNIRTCYILMNKLLHDHGQSLTLLMDPNRMDFCSVEELIKMVKDGQQLFKKMVEHATSEHSLKPLVLRTNDEMQELKTIQCKPEGIKDASPELLNKFIKDVIDVNRGIRKTPYSPLFCGLFSTPTSGEKTKKDYSLALINACIDGESEMIRKALIHADKVDFSSTTQGQTALDLLKKNKKISAVEREELYEKIEILQLESVVQSACVVSDL